MNLTHHIEKHRIIGNAVGGGDPYLSVTFDTDDGGREGFVLKVVRDLDGNIDPTRRYRAYSAYGDRAEASEAATCVRRLLLAWGRRVQDAGVLTHEGAVFVALDQLLANDVHIECRRAMTIREWVSPS